VLSGSSCAETTQLISCATFFHNQCQHCKRKRLKFVAMVSWPSPRPRCIRKASERHHSNTCSVMQLTRVLRITSNNSSFLASLARSAIVLFSKIVAQDRSNGCTLLNIPGHKMDGLVAFFSVLSLPSPALLFRAITANYTQPCALCMPWRTPIATASLEPGVLAMAEHHPSTHLPSYKAIWPESTGPMSQTPELILVPTMNPHWTRTFNRWAPVIVMSLPIRTLSEAPSCKASNPSMTLRDNSEQSSQSTCSRNGPHGFQDPEYRYDFPASVIMHC
jgi:hypothetical protein